MSPPQDRFNVSIGCAFLLAVAVVLYLGGAWVYHRYYPAPSFSVAVSAWFESPAAGELRVSGVVLENGTPVKRGRLRLSVEDWKKMIRQSVFLDVTDGRFETGQQPAFRTLREGDRLRIRAEYNKNGEEAAAEEVYLGARIPHVTTKEGLVVLGVALCFTLGFLWLFTGPPQRGKNTAAIVVSYLVMVLFLAVPLALPSVISVMSPEVMAIMRETPVGVLDADPGQGTLGRQWVLNIGGVVVASRPAAPAQSTAAAAAPIASPSPSATPNPSVTPSPSATSTPQPAATTTGAAKPAVPEDTAATIQGGVAVPLYVLILSLIGAAINMTRKLPGFQREAAVLPSLTDAVASAVDMMTSGVKALARKAPPQPPEPPPQGEPAAIAQSETEADQTPEETTEESVLRKTAEWRRDLITQHMYLLSAPFLAIAVYYLLAWLNLLQQPALVLVSFSIGLMSDKIVAKILGIASGIVDTGGQQTQQSTTAAAKTE